MGIKTAVFMHVLYLNGRFKLIVCFIGKASMMCDLLVIAIMVCQDGGAPQRQTQTCVNDESRKYHDFYGFYMSFIRLLYELYMSFIRLLYEFYVSGFKLPYKIDIHTERHTYLCIYLHTRTHTLRPASARLHICVCIYIYT